MVTELPHVSLIIVTEPPMTHPLHPLDSCEVHPLTVCRIVFSVIVCVWMKLYLLMDE